MQNTEKYAMTIHCHYCQKRILLTGGFGKKYCGLDCQEKATKEQERHRQAIRRLKYQIRQIEQKEKMLS